MFVIKGINGHTRDIVRKIFTTLDCVMNGCDRIDSIFNCDVAVFDIKDEEHYPGWINQQTTAKHIIWWMGEEDSIAQGANFVIDLNEFNPNITENIIIINKE